MLEQMLTKNLTLLRIMLFCLIPIGAFLLYKSIMMVRKTFGGKVLLELPFTQKSATFEIPQAGVYSIWQKGQYFKKLPVDKFKPVICNELTKEKIALTPSIFRPNSNDGITVKIELFRFSAEPGKYSIDLIEGSSITKLETVISSLFPAKKADINKYYILVRESQPFYYVLLGIPLIVVSGLLMIGGLVIGILADQIFK